MDLICYLHPAWAPLIRPAPATRAWMDASPEAFAYRCLPLNIANAHGWEVLNPQGFTAEWDGGPGLEAVTVRPDDISARERLAVSLFGQGVLTFHVEGIIRTPPGWNLWVSGSPNRFKDAIAPLAGVIETDWAPFTFTMNWRFTRSHAPVRFEAMEPFAFLFPMKRGAVEAFAPRFAPLADDPELEQKFTAWSASRDAFHRAMVDKPPAAPADRWQKHYYRGMDVSGQAQADDHQTKLRLKTFDRSTTPAAPTAPMTDTAAPAAPSESKELVRLRRALAKREWLMETLERQRDLVLASVGIERRENLSSEEFLERYYAVNRPVILMGQMDVWPALELWTPEYLKRKVGAAVVEYQGDRAGSGRFEIDKAAHRRTLPFDAFIRAITEGEAGNDLYLTAYNSRSNASALAPLAADQRLLERFLDPTGQSPNGMMWIGAKGTFTPLHHDLTNNLIAQVVGRKRVLLLPASEVGRLENNEHVFSDITDLEANLDLARHPRLANVRAYPIDLEPGDILFVPLGWWHQVRALDFSVTLTFTNFRWRNDAAFTWPGD